MRRSDVKIGSSHSLLNKLSNASVTLFRRYLEFENEASSYPGAIAKNQNSIRCSKALLNFIGPTVLNLPNPLTEYEIFLLLVAAIIEDLLPQPVQSPTQQKAVSTHIESFLAASSLSTWETSIITEICRPDRFPNPDYRSPKEKLRVPVLAGLLRLAKLLGRLDKSRQNSGRTSVCDESPWLACRFISSLRVTGAPEWNIGILANARDAASERLLQSLRSEAQLIVDAVSPLLRKTGIFFGTVTLELNKSTRSGIKNPFLRLAAFGEDEDYLFAGRDSEIGRLLPLVFKKRLVIVIGESGVGKSSLVEAGVLPIVKQFAYGVVRFTFSQDPIAELLAALRSNKGKRRKPLDILTAVESRLRVSERSKLTGLVIVGDHLEQMFTHELSTTACDRTIEGLARILRSSLPVTLLFCIREDYLPELYELSARIPEFYNRENTFRLHKLDEAGATAAINRASGYAKYPLPIALVKRIVADLREEGRGTIYPPYLQIVGYSLYARLQSEGCRLESSAETLYEQLGGVENIVNDYLESLLDGYSQAERPIVMQILGTMVTDYYTKKRISEEELRRRLPECDCIGRLLTRLENHRIVKRSLGDYELMHDLLARRVIELLKHQNYLSPPVRVALLFIEEHYADPNLSAGDVAKAAGVSQPHLASLFRSQLGQTITRRINAKKIGAAKTAIQSVLLSMRDIGKRAGFSSLSVFSRKFKLVEGISPIEYRKLVMRDRISIPMDKPRSNHQRAVRAPQATTKAEVA